MKTDMHKKIEIAANIAIIIVATLLCGVLIKKHIISPPTPPANALIANNQFQLQAGTKLSLPGIDWQKNSQTLLLVLSTTCHFCSESAPFYQQLVKELDGNTHVVAVLPQSVSDSRGYLNRLGVAVDDIQQAEMSSLGVRGTPTLILANDKGVVMDSWVGKLPNDEQAKLINRVRQSIAQK
jgi:thiol-disulfide isomerase/thioredoxin